MVKLIVTEAGGGTQELLLENERTTIGRHPDNDLCLNDKSVSGRHAVVVRILDDAFIEDLDSTNGTQVNGRQIAKHPLADGDVITIGRNSLRYEGPAIAGDEFDQTMVLRPDALAAAVGERPATAPQLGRLEVLSGANAGRQLELTKPLTTLGKPGVQVAAITRRAEGYYIVHVSGEGQRPRVNNIEVDTAAQRLSAGDEIELAGTRMRFTLS